MNTVNEKTKLRSFEIKVDDRIFEFDKPKVKGKEILLIAEKAPIECFSLYQKLKGCDFEKISYEEEVDLSHPGLEKFTVKESEVYHYTVDGEPETTEEKFPTANQILEWAGLEPSKYYLYLIPENGQPEKNWKDNPNDKIEMKCPGLKFVSATRSGTPVAGE